MCGTTLSRLHKEKKGCVVQADLVDYWAVGGEGAEFRRVVPGARSLLKFLSGNSKLERLFSQLLKFCLMRHASLLMCELC